MKKTLLWALALALVFSFSACGGAASAPGGETPADTTSGTQTDTQAPGTPNRYASFVTPVGEFTPSVRFVFASDTHVVDRGTKSLTLLRQMMAALYEYADGQPYSAIDALVLTGDITSNAEEDSTTSVRAVFDESLREGTRLLLCLGNHDVRTDLPGFDAEAEAEALGGTAQTDAVVGGIPLVGLSSPTGSGSYFDEISDSIAARLEAAAEAADGMPVFVFQHYPPSGVFESLLEKYPNIVDFYGHTHASINEYKTLRQNVFSQIDLGAFGAPGAGAGYGSSEEYAENYAPCWVVEVDADGSVLLMPFDANLGVFLTKNNGEPFYYYIEKPGDTASYQYRGLPANIPEFPDFSVRTELCTERGAILSFSTATDGTDIAEYAYTVTDRASGRVLLNSSCECTYTLVPEPARRSFLLTGVEPGTECTLSISATNSCGRVSRTVTADFTVPEHFLPERRVSGDGLFTDFDGDGSFSAGVNFVYRAQLPGDFVDLGPDNRLNLFRFENLKLTEREGNTLLSVKSDYNDTQEYRDLEFHLYSTAENGIPNSYPGAEYLRVWADFTDVGLETGDFGVISSSGAKYRLRPGADTEYFFLADGGDTWVARRAGDASALGDTDTKSVKGLRGYFAFRLADMQVDRITSYGLVEEGTPPDATDIAGVFFEWKYQTAKGSANKTARGTSFFLDDIALVADHAKLH